MRENQSGTITILARIPDCEQEQEYVRMEYISSRPLLIAGAVTLGLLYSAFAIPQILFSSARNFNLILFVRIAFSLYFFVLAGVISVSKSPLLYRVMVYIMEFLFPLSYLVILYLSGQFDFLIKCLDIILITTIIFVVPSSWLNAVIAGAYMILSFIAYTLLLQKNIGIDTFSAGVTYIMLFYLINLLYSQRFYCYKRRKFLNLVYAQRLIDTDALTGTASRIKLSDACARYIELSDMHNTPLCLTVFDIDNFKQINDTHGHITGDRVLVGLCHLVCACLSDRELLARWGGEEFVILLPDTSLAEARVKVGQLREKISSFEFEGGIHLTCSFGLAAKRAGDDMNALIDYTDKLLYAAKERGKNLVLTYEEL